jgi:DNA (cytosine-5)-methyltransferase 1
VACPPLLVPAGGTWNQDAVSTLQPFRTRTSRESEALVRPWSPAMIMRNNTARGDPGQMSSSVDEPIRTLTTTGNQSLIRWDHLMYGYDSGQLRSVREPLPTQTTVDGDALLGPEIDVDDCTFRMLEPAEIGAAMAFPSDYTVLGNRRERIRQFGNAVTPNCARDLISALVAAITGEAP